MRMLTVSDISAVSGGAEVTVSAGGASVTVKGDPGGFGKAVIDIYEGAVDATSYMIERVANAFKAL